MINFMQRTHWEKYTGFTFGLNKKDTVKRGKKPSHLDHLFHDEASGSDEQSPFSS